MSVHTIVEARNTDFHRRESWLPVEPVGSALEEILNQPARRKRQGDGSPSAVLELEENTTLTMSAKGWDFRLQCEPGCGDNCLE